MAIMTSFFFNTLPVRFQRCFEAINCNWSHTRLHCLITPATIAIKHAIISLCLSRSLPRSVSPYPSRGTKESCKSICIRHLTSISHVLGEWHHLLLCGFVERRQDGWLSSRPSWADLLSRALFPQECLVLSARSIHLPEYRIMRLSCANVWNIFSALH